MKFGLIGDGKIAVKHRHAISNNGGDIIAVHDPKYGNESISLDDPLFLAADYIVICSPSFIHRKHIKFALKHDKKMVVEKPMVLPWEPIIDDNRINVVLQLRWMDLPEAAKEINVTMVRDEEYFKTWEGNAKLTGGLFYHLFIHYIDLAIKLRAKFIGEVVYKGVQIRRIDSLNMFDYDMNDLYTEMYNDIINHDGGVKPEELYYVHWVLERCGWKYGINGKDLMNKTVSIDLKNGIDI